MAVDLRHQSPIVIGCEAFLVLILSQMRLRRQHLPNLVRTTSGNCLSQNLGIPCPAQLEA